jgi:hypothetical protein
MESWAWIRSKLPVLHSIKHNLFDEYNLAIVVVRRVEVLRQTIL